LDTRRSDAATRDKTFTLAVLPHLHCTVTWGTIC